MLFISQDSKLGPLERVMSVFTKVEAKEGNGVTVLFANGFLLLLAYYLLKPVRESLILSQNSAEIRSYAVAVIACVLLLLVPIYSNLYRRFGRGVLLPSVMLFFIGSLIALATLGQAGYQIGFVFFVWLGVFSVTMVAQFWALAADLYDPSQGKRLFPLIAVGISIGAWLGSRISTAVYSLIGAYGLMVAAVCVLCVVLILTQVAQRVVPGRRGLPVTGVHRPKPHVLGGYSLVLGDRYLCLLAVSAVLLNWINSTGDFILAKIVIDHAAGLVEMGQVTASQDEAIGIIYGRYYGTVTLLGLIIQLLLVSRVFRAVGIAGAALILPALMLFGYALISFVPVFSLIYFYMVLENSGNYSLHNTARHALFLPVEQAAKFEGKTTIDTCFWRLGDLIQAGAIYIGSNLLGFNLIQFAMANFALAIGFLWVSLAARRRYLGLPRTKVEFKQPELCTGLPSRAPSHGNPVPNPQTT
jgi:ATP:ADP antiporter, AAA family